MQSRGLVWAVCPATPASKEASNYGVERTRQARSTFLRPTACSHLLDALGSAGCWVPGLSGRVCAQHVVCRVIELASLGFVGFFFRFRFLKARIWRGCQSWAQQSHQAGGCNDLPSRSIKDRECIGMASRWYRKADGQCPVSRVHERAHSLFGQQRWTCKAHNDPAGEHDNPITRPDVVATATEPCGLVRSIKDAQLMNARVFGGSVWR